MKLEQVARMYGMTDYLEPSTGKIYQLSEAMENDKGSLDVPVFKDGVFIGYTTMEKVK